MTDVTCALFGKNKGNDRISTFLFPPIQEMGQFEMRKNDMVYRLAEFHLSHLVFGYFAYNINNTDVNSSSLPLA